MVPDPHVQVVQNTYAKGGSGVFKAKLWPAEVDPRLKICLDALGLTCQIKWSSLIKDGRRIN